MAGRLAGFVHVNDDNGRRHVFGPDDTVPDWAAVKISNPDAWVSDDAEDSAEPVDVEGAGTSTEEQNPPPPGAAQPGEGGLLAAGDEELPAKVADATIPDVLNAIYELPDEDQPAAAARVLEVEQGRGDDARKTLVEQLEKLSSPGE